MPILWKMHCLDIDLKLFPGSVSDGEGGVIYFDASQNSALSVDRTKFWQSSAFSGAAISLNGGRNNARRNTIVASEFAGLAASERGGSILLKNSNLDVNISSFINNFAVSGASSVESVSSSLLMSGNNVNFTGAPQLSLSTQSSFSDSASYFDNGGLYCPLPYCHPARIKNGQVCLSTYDLYFHQS